MDIGAHIGIHSLYAAQLGAKVLAIEPSPEHLPNLHKAAVLNGFTDRFMIIAYAVSDRRTSYNMSKALNNSGHTFILPENGNNYSAGLANTSFRVSSIILDDLIPVLQLNSDVTIVKVDVESFECMVFRNSVNFLTKLFVPYIFMEWAFVFERDGFNIIRHKKLRSPTANHKKLRSLS